MTTNNPAARTNIFDEMFGIVDEAAEKKKQQQAEQAAKLEAEKANREAKAAEIREKVANNTDAKPATPSEKKEVNLFTPNESTIIRFYGESLDINTYFTSEELAEGLLVTKKGQEPERQPLNGEMLRKRMEEEYPELVKEHTEMIYIKARNIIIPTMKAKKKGNCTKVLSNDNTSLILRDSKIPFSVLRDFIAVATMYGESNLEVHADIYFCLAKKEYFLDYPKQVVNPNWVEIVEDSHSIFERVDEAVKVIEIHSHHTMLPYPSRQDDKSERVPGRYYAIIGRTEQFFPIIYLRQFISDEIGHVIKDSRDFFENPFFGLPESFNINGIEIAGAEK